MPTSSYKKKNDLSGFEIRRSNCISVFMDCIHANVSFTKIAASETGTANLFGAPVLSVCF